MEAFTPFWFFLLPLGAALTWAACHWWYGRRLRKLEQRFVRMNADREAVQEQLKRARQQLAQVQKDLSVQRDSAAPAKVTTRVPASAPAAAKPPPALAGGLVFERPQTAAHGFADTMPFQGDALST